jgi:CYTH domain-containing protein
MEIEKKFLITEIPGDKEAYRHYEIEQAYLCSSPTVRIRRRDDEYFLTVKSKPAKDKAGKGNTLVNEEYEINIPKEAYEHLYTKIDGDSLAKTRYLVPLAGGLTAEVDIFKGRLLGLQFAEVEFPDIRTAEEFVMPDWFVRDVSGDRRYRNSEIIKLDKYDEKYFSD